MVAVIMAGGWGERLWPLSRKDLPKQFSPLLDGGTLLQETARRVSLLVPPENIYLITGRAYLDRVRAQLPWVPEANLIGEPVERDTAPCLALAAAVLGERAPETVMAVLPADHLVAGDDEFRATLEKARAAATITGGLVTIGVRPTRPEVGYGYIEPGDEEVPGLEGCRRVKRFAEKPHLEQAIEYVAAGRHLWNSGVFVWTLGAIREAIATHLPELSEGIRPVEEATCRGDFERAVAECFPRLPRISIDFGVMEKADNVWVVPASFSWWDDLGSWAAMERVMHTDQDGNCLRGQVSVLDTRGTVVHSSGGRLVVALDARQLVIVDTPDVVLVASKAAAPHLKRLLAHLREQGLGEYVDSSRPGATSALWDSVASCHKTVQKPWGREIWWALTGSYAGKIIQVKAGHSLSLQYHRTKRETMLFLEGEGQMEVDGRKIDLSPPMAVDIEPGMVHRVTATRDITFMEVSTPEVEDVVRLKDRYGRTPEGS